jgi:hypothetical protein
MANPWFGSDVAARFALATVRAAVLHAVEHCVCRADAMLSADAMLIMHMKLAIAAKAAAKES